jgi:serine/threonine-protein kinase
MDKIGPYQILEVLHRGPQPLYRAKAADGRIVAIKAAPSAAANAESRERFSREGETCRSLNHPHLVRVLDAGEADGMMYQVMEMLDGADFSKVMAEGREFTWDQKLALMEQVCEGLQYAHEHNLVHRDIKPANLFLENSGRAVVLDFGMVRVAESELTKAGSAVGTINFMAPEQIHGERCSPASDVFSAGIVFFQFASGRHPFSTKDKSLAQVVSAIVFEPAPKLSAICPDAPEGLEFLLNRALEKDAAKRFRNAGELKQAIAVCRIAMAQGVAAPSAPSPDKTKVFEKAAPPAAAQAVAAPVDSEKTQVFQRPAAAAPLPPPKRAVPPPPPPAPEPVQPKPAPGLRFRYCPSCTTANPPDAAACSRCGTRLAEGGAAAAKSTNWGMYIAIGVAALLAIVLIVVLVAK